MKTKNLVLCFAAALVSFACAGYSAEKGLVGYWSFDEGSGTAVKDSSGNKCDGTMEAAKWVKGKVGGGLELNGVDSIVEIEDKACLDPTAAISIEFWIKPLVSPNVDENNNWRYVITKGGWGSYHVILEESLVFCGTVKANGEDQRWFNATPIDIGSWSLCVFTFDAATGKAQTYINGKLDMDVEKNAADIDVNEDPLRFGWSSGTDAPNGAGCPSAVIDEVKIYNRVLALDEVAAHYKAVK